MDKEVVWGMTIKTEYVCGECGAPMEYTGDGYTKGILKCTNCFNHIHDA